MKKEHLLRLQPGVVQRMHITSLEEDFAKIGLVVETREKKERGTAKAVSRATRSADRADARHAKEQTSGSKEDAGKASERMVRAAGEYLPKGLTKKESINRFHAQHLSEVIRMAKGSKPSIPPAAGRTRLHRAPSQQLDKQWNKRGVFV